MQKIRYPQICLQALLLGLLFAAAAEARSGCCSHHGGVCGCSCCDGSPLSSICAPYYPNCGSQPPQAPYNLTAELSSPTKVLLRWVDDSTDETSFRIERRAGASIFQEVSSVGTNVTSATVAPLAPDTSYVFRVRARNAQGDSATTNEAGVTTPPAPKPEPCSPSGTDLCLLESRFKVEATWRTPDGGSGMARVVKLTDDSGYLWFFAASNIEAIVKVLDGCALNNRFWVFAGGLTNVETVLTVTDSQTGIMKTYTNHQRTPFQPIQDTSAFETCP
ncbi:MAG TPA: fibronectin type III domain-containing protein [Thermoanaerobaculia bacterium]|nr:fibronectin type III domain-containing protein [Thermoanaerobaculia bacterium]